MLTAFTTWLDHRTGYKSFLNTMLLEHIPGGAKWRYVWGSALAFVFTIQLVTGALLMTAYAPSDTSAWASVYFIQYEMDFGWLIRGLHHYGSQTMVVLLALHMLQVVIAGAHLPPREVNWWLGVILMSLVLGLSLTGYLLPWDQKGFFATQVATNIAGSLPGAGPTMQKLLVGGPTYGNHTLTRFFALHVWILPALVVLFLALHIIMFRRHGITVTAKAQASGITGWFWPDQAFRDLIVGLVIFGIMLALVLFGGHGNSISRGADVQNQGLYEYWAKAGQRGLGANLDAPADPLTEGYPARPEWYFLFLFQLLKYFEGPKILIGTVVIPNGVLFLLLLLPLLGYGRMRTFGHLFGVLVVTAVLIGAGTLTILAMADDSPEPVFFGLVQTKDKKKAEDFQHRQHQAEAEAKRAVEMASAGIPVEGARAMLRTDPLTRGSKRFEVVCASCHSFTPGTAESDGVEFNNKKVKYTASDLAGWGSSAWVRGLLSNPGDDKFFGRTSLEGMKKWRKNVDKQRERWKAKDPAEATKKIAEQEAEFDAIAKFLGQQSKRPKERDPEIEKKGLELFSDSCGSCHRFGKEGGEDGPDLTEYGSAEWLRTMLMAPDHVSRFGASNRMPAFRNLEGPGSELVVTEFKNLYKDDKGEGRPLLHLSDIQREMIIRFVLRDHRAVFGGAEISGPPRK